MHALFKNYSNQDAEFSCVFSVFGIYRISVLLLVCFDMIHDSCFRAMVFCLRVKPLCWYHSRNTL